MEKLFYHLLSPNLTGEDISKMAYSFFKQDRTQSNAP
jgi:hypothetical protein